MPLACSLSVCLSVCLALERASERSCQIASPTNGLTHSRSPPLMERREEASSMLLQTDSLTFFTFTSYMLARAKVRHLFSFDDFLLTYVSRPTDRPTDRSTRVAKATCSKFLRPRVRPSGQTRSARRIKVPRPTGRRLCGGRILACVGGKKRGTCLGVN